MDRAQGDEERQRGLGPKRGRCTRGRSPAVVGEVEVEQRMLAGVCEE